MQTSSVSYVTKPGRDSESSVSQIRARKSVRKIEKKEIKQIFDVVKWFYVIFDNQLPSADKTLKYLPAFAMQGEIRFISCLDRILMCLSHAVSWIIEHSFEL